MIRIIELLCPARHCVIAAAYNPQTSNGPEVIGMLGERRKALKLNPWCGFCGSTDLQYEDAETRFDDMESAMPALKAAEQDNIKAMKAAAMMPKQN